MTPITLSLVVLRSANIELAAAFYSKLGLVFKLHRHGKGAEHYAAEMPGFVFELYPLTADGLTTTGSRIGFTVPSIDEVIASLNDYPNAVVSAAKDSEWGRRAVIADPDGHRIELLERQGSG
jgi:lactoylglutathione lyase